MTNEDEWKKLTPEQYKVLRQKGTEKAFSGKYWDDHSKGWYTCAGCGTQLFASGGTVNTTVDLVVTTDGFYPVRLVWFETGGGSGAECLPQRDVFGRRYYGGFRYGRDGPEVILCR